MGIAVILQMANFLGFPGPGLNLVRIGSFFGYASKVLQKEGMMYSVV